MQTIKCLLIDPNPESALNEEAGKLLLEAYDEYAKHARLWTTIHAQKEVASLKAASKERSASSTTTQTAAGASAVARSKASGAKTVKTKKTAAPGTAAKKTEAGEQKKKSLKRL